MSATTRFAESQAAGANERPPDRHRRASSASSPAAGMRLATWRSFRSRSRCPARAASKARRSSSRRMAPSCSRWARRAADSRTRTTASQIVGDVLGDRPERISMAGTFDSALSPWGVSSSNSGNNFHLYDVGAVHGAATRLREKVLTLAAHVLQAEKSSLCDRGRCRVQRVRRGQDDHLRPARQDRLRQPVAAALRASSRGSR